MSNKWISRPTKTCTFALVNYKLYSNHVIINYKSEKFQWGIKMVSQTEEEHGKTKNIVSQHRSHLVIGQRNYSVELHITQQLGV